MQDRLASNGDGYVVGRVYIQAGEPGRRHADDREGMAVQPDGLADDFGVGREIPLPEAVADHRHRSRTSAAVEIVIGSEDAAAHGRHAQDAKEISAGPQTFGERALAAVRQIEAGGVEGQGPREGLLVVADRKSTRLNSSHLVLSY